MTDREKVLVKLYIRNEHCRLHTACMYAGCYLVDDEDVAIYAVERKGSDLRDVYSGLRDNPNIVLPAVANDGLALEFAGENCKKNKEIVLVAVKQNGLALQFADRTLRANEEVVLAAIENNPNAFKYADYSIKKTKKFALKALNNGATCFEHIISEFWGDKDIAIAGLKISEKVVERIHKKLWSDKEVVLTALNKGYDISKYIDEKLYDDKDIIRAHIKAKIKLERLSPIIMQDTNFLLELFQMAGNDFNILAFVNNINFILGALRINFYRVCVEIISRYYSTDRAMITAAVMVHPDGLYYADDSLKNDEEFVVGLARINFNVVRWASNALKKSKSFMLKVVEINGLALIYADKKLQQNEELVFAAAKNNIRILEYVKPRLQRKIKKRLESNEPVKQPKRVEFKRMEDLPPAEKRFVEFTDELKELKAYIKLISDEGERNRILHYYSVAKDYFDENAGRLCNDDFTEKPDSTYADLIGIVYAELEPYRNSIQAHSIMIEQIEDVVKSIQNEKRRMAFQTSIDFIKEKKGTLSSQTYQELVNSTYEEVCKYKAKELNQVGDDNSEKKIYK